MTMPREELERLVEQALAGSRCSASDLTGTQDHWSLHIEWEGFAGKSLLEQHRTVMEVLKPHMEGGGNGRIHAVQLKTVLPATP